MDVRLGYPHPRLTRGSYTSYFTLQISNKTARFLRDLHRARGRSRGRLEFCFFLSRISADFYTGYTRLGIRSIGGVRDTWMYVSGTRYVYK